MSNIKPYVIGIDASNIRGGGGITHLIEILRAAQPELHGIERIVVWGSNRTLSKLEDSPWLNKYNPPMLNHGALKRQLWQHYYLPQAARDEGCCLLFIPGGSYFGNFHPVITMSRNLLPFEMSESRRYGLTFAFLRLFLLYFIQIHTFRKSDGVIFLNSYAQDIVLGATGKLKGKTTKISHGVNNRFYQAPKIQYNITEYNNTHPYSILYVSIVNQYKHQWHVVEAIAALRKQGLPIVLNLIGPSYPPSLKRLNKTIDRFDKDRSWVHYHGDISFDELQAHYAKADLGLFASSCENMPNILLETMASGLPIACSNRGPMREILGSGGAYFDPEQPDEIANVLHDLIESPELRAKLAKRSYKRSQQYSWKRCADETFKFINMVIKIKNGSNACAE